MPPKVQYTSSSIIFKKNVVLICENLKVQSINPMLRLEHKPKA